MIQKRAYFGVFLGALATAFSARVNPACLVCTVAVGASLSLARRLGALLTLLGYWSILWFDKKGWRFLASVLLGAGIYIVSQKGYGFLKEKNGGHAHFPFEKVALPLVFLGVASVCLTYV